MAEGAGNYKGTVAGETAEALTYSITQKSIADVSIEGIQDKYSQKNDGTAKKPAADNASVTVEILDSCADYKAVKDGNSDRDWKRKLCCAE